MLRCYWRGPAAGRTDVLRELPHHRSSGTASTPSWLGTAGRPAPWCTAAPAGPSPSGDRASSQRSERSPAGTADRRCTRTRGSQGRQARTASTPAGKIGRARHRYGEAATAPCPGPCAWRAVCDGASPSSPPRTAERWERYLRRVQGHVPGAADASAGPPSTRDNGRKTKLQRVVKRADRAADGSHRTLVV